MLFVGRERCKRIGRREFLILGGDIAEQKRPSVAITPFRQRHAPFAHLADLELVLIVPPPVAGVCILCDPAFLDRQQRQMEVALSLIGRSGQHAGHRGINALQRWEAEFRRGIGVLQHVDEFLGPPVVRALPPRLQ